ncbi:GNAT family N-acetyltransferase [uncultured Cohaesibacter sp.]|uniref:GNAT family N-acetyltransferase n=1 Tax=uncultured Cohaesibacter sp. TaxID=1002546 RepID=UPI0029C6E770|nr:GNAT family N-acetyltransferase [uncultured Cohaesibacter sp.]
MTKSQSIEGSSEPMIRFRMAQKSDASLLHRMVGELAAFLGDQGKHTATVADYEAFGFGERPAFDALIAELEEKPLGMCLYFGSFSTWMGKPGLYIQDLYVSDDARGLGLGRKLVERVAEIGRGRGCQYLRLSVDAANVSAQGFYEACGFRWSDAEKLYAAKGEAFLALAAAGGNACKGEHS